MGVGGGAEVSGDALKLGHQTAFQPGKNGYITKRMEAKRERETDREREREIKGRKKISKRMGRERERVSERESEKGEINIHMIVKVRADVMWMSSEKDN